MTLLGTITRGRIRSFRSRLLLFTGLSCAVAAMLVCAALVARQHVRTQELVAQTLVTQSEIIAFNVTTMVSFDDADAAKDTLSSLALTDNLEQAHIVDGTGMVFASFVRDAQRELPRFLPQSRGLYREHGWMVYYQPIREGDELLGTLVLVYDGRWLMRRLWENVAVSLVVAVVAMGLAMFLALQLQRALARPVSELVATSRRVSETGDYSLKAEKYDDDELGELTDTFNAMLDQVCATEVQLLDREQRLRTLTNAVPAFVWSSDPKGHVRELNDKWFEYTGMSRSEASDEQINEQIHPDDRDGVHEAWTEAVKATSPFEAELRIRRHDGEYRWFLSRAIPLHDSEGNVSGWFGTATDIEDRKQAEASRAELLVSERAARSEAERTSRMKDEFVATLSHELRTPMTAILGWTQLLMNQEITDESIIEGLETIERNARTQAQMIEDLLDISRIVSGKIRLDVQVVQLPDVIDAAVGTVEPAVRAKEIRLRKFIDPNVGPMHGDPHRLQQIIWNLLSNAVKFTPKGGQVQVTLQRINSHIEINVSDTGEGFDPEFAPHLFDRFRQSDSSMSREFGGLGLGLAIVKHLTELHGGQVSASSPGKGQGATFTVSLPLAIVHPREETERVHPTRSPGVSLQLSETEATKLHGLRVLVVEDQPDARTLIQRLLENARAEVKTASSATEGLQLMEDYTPDVIVSDIGMPGLDGYEFIREVRKRPIARGGRIPAVALTAFARSEDRTRSLLAGYQMHVAKPVEPSELLAAVASVAVSRTEDSSDGQA